MTPPGIRLLFDENFGKPLVGEIERLLSFAEPEEQAEVKHVLDFQSQIGLESQGIWDDVWIPQIVKEGWIVIAADRGKKGLKKGQKLPRLCVQYGVTHFLIGPAVHRRKRFCKLLTVLSVWHELLALARESPRGSRFMIEPSGSSREHCARGRITKRDITPQPIRPSPPVPGHLF